MNFDEAQRNCRERVTQGNAGMRERAGVDDDEIGAIGARQMDAIDKRALVISLKKHDLRIFPSRGGSKFAFDVGQRLSAIHCRLTRSQKVQVGAVEDQNSASHRRARLISLRGTSSQIVEFRG